MFKFLIVGLLLFVFAGCGRMYYVVRHAEKEPQSDMMTSDVLLSDAGRERAAALRNALVHKDIRRIFSTNTLRTVATAKPLSEQIDVDIELYEPTDTLFVARLKGIKGNALIVGHSNTVDDIVNGLIGRTELQDLNNTEYDNLFIVKRKGEQNVLEKRKYGVAQW